MKTLDEIVKQFEFGAQPYAKLYRASAPTPASVKKISEALRVRIPETFVRFATSCPSYGAWFASIGEDYKSYLHILNLNRQFHDQTDANFLPDWLVMFNHGHDGDCDCFDLRSVGESQEHPLLYYSVSESPQAQRSPEPMILAPSFHAYIEGYAVLMATNYEKYLEKKRAKQSSAKII